MASGGNQSDRTGAFFRSAKNSGKRKEQVGIVTGCICPDFTKGVSQDNHPTQKQTKAASGVVYGSLQIKVSYAQVFNLIDRLQLNLLPWGVHITP